MIPETPGRPPIRHPALPGRFYPAIAKNRGCSSCAGSGIVPRRLWLVWCRLIVMDAHQAKGVRAVRTPIVMRARIISVPLTRSPAEI